MKKVEQSIGLLALGANLPTSAGNPSDTLRAVLHRLHDSEITLLAASRFWKTPAFPIGSGPDYTNAAAKIRTELSAEVLLSRLHAIEAELGRVRGAGRWQSRGVDVDLLALDDQVYPDAATQDAWRALPLEQQKTDAPDRLILPHPRLQDRAFVLVPLVEIAPDWRHPRLGLTVREMHDALPADAFEGMALLA